MPYDERLRPYGPTIGESTGGQLPSIEIIAGDLSDRVKTIDSLSHRMAKLTYMTEEIRQNAAQRPAASELNQRQQDILATLYLDCVDYSVWNSVLDNKKTKRRNGADLNLEELYPKISTAHERLRGNLMLYESAFADAPDGILYRGLEAIMYDANCLVYDRSDEDHYYRLLLITNGLAGVLAEHKVLKALHKEGLTSARYATSSEDRHLKWDIVDESELENTGGLKAVQVKSRTLPAGVRAQAELDQAGVVRVLIPNNPSESYFSLNSTDSRALANALRQAPTAHMPLMYGKFQKALAKFPTQEYR